MNNYQKYNWYDKTNDKVIQCDWAEYSKLMNHTKELNSTVRHDKFKLRTGYRVSTVCLSKDYAFFKESVYPVLFETMVFCEGDDRYHSYCEIHNCLNQAKKRHDEIVLKIIRREKINERSKTNEISI